MREPNTNPSHPHPPPLPPQRGSPKTCNRLMMMFKLSLPTITCSNVSFFNDFFNEIESKWSFFNRNIEYLIIFDQKTTNFEFVDEWSKS